MCFLSPDLGVKRAATTAERDAEDGLVRRQPAIVLSLLAAVLAASVLFLALPATLHAGNTREFAWPLWSILFTYRYLALGLMVVYVLPTLLLPRRFVLLWAAGCSAFALYLWAYGSFVVYDFGLIDGHNWRIQPRPAAMVAESMLAVLGLVAAFVVARRSPGAVAVALLVLGLGNAVSAARAVHADPRQPPPSRDFSALFRFSTAKNVLVVLLDSLQSDIFEEVVRETPGLEDALDGFTLYVDTAGVAPSTYLAMPAIHSGLVYDRRSSLRAYFDEGVARGSFLNALSHNGYEAVLVNPYSGLCPESVTLCATDTEVLGGGGKASLARDAALLLDLTLLRVAPLALKGSVYNNGRWRIAPLAQDPRLVHPVVTGLNLQKELAAKLSAADQPPTAKFLHLFDTHLPLVLDQRCVFTGETVRRYDLAHLQEGVRADYKIQVGCSLEAFRAVLAALKREGVYANTVIVLLGDHGNPGPGMASSRVGPGRSGRIPGSMIGRANPTLAVKPMNGNGPLRRSRELVSLADVSAIICESVGDCVGRRRAPGASRTYNFYHWSESHLEQDRISNIVGYEIEGSLFESRNWRLVDPGPGAIDSGRERTALVSAGEAGKP
jgi:hypothetical protein